MVRQGVFAGGVALLLSVLTLAANADEHAVREAEGLWEYTGLVTRDGESLPLTGIFLISEGTFLQQSIFNGEPFGEMGAMAHVGPYWAGGAGMRLTSQQTLSMDPEAEPPLRSAGSMEHDLAVTREGDELTLVFGGGTSTVQTFRRIGDAADTELYRFADGALAFADGYFILVIGEEHGAVTGYGSYDRDGEQLSLHATRWSASDGEHVLNLRDTTIPAVFDGNALKLPGGQRFLTVRKTY
jgi:hypothetical protein